MKKTIVITLLMLFAHSAVAENKWKSANDKKHASIVNEQGSLFAVAKSSKNIKYLVFYNKLKNHKIKGFVKSKANLAEMSFQVDNRAAHDLVGYYGEKKQYIEPLAYHPWLLNELSCGNTLKLTYNTDKGKKTAQFSLKDSTWAISRIEGINFKADCSKKGVMNKKVIKELPAVGAWVLPSGGFSCGVVFNNVKKIKMYSSYDKRNHYCSYDKKGRLLTYEAGPQKSRYFYNKNGKIKRITAWGDGTFYGMGIKGGKIRTERYTIDGYGNVLFSFKDSPKITSVRRKYIKKNGIYNIEMYESNKLSYTDKYNNKGYEVKNSKYEFDADGQYTKISFYDKKIDGVYLYDKEGKGIKGRSSKNKGEASYQYDYKGNWIKRNFTSNHRAFNSTITRKITYWR